MLTIANTAAIIGSSLLYLVKAMLSPSRHCGITSATFALLLGLNLDAGFAAFSSQGYRVRILGHSGDRLAQRSASHNSLDICEPLRIDSVSVYNKPRSQRELKAGHFNHSRLTGGSNG